MTRRALGLVLSALLASACGAGGPRVSRELRSQLRSDEVEAARERAPDLIAQVESALDEADAAERAGDELAAADHATRARLYLEAARAEAARVDDDTARAALERTIGEVLEQARRDEAAREEISRELSRLAAVRTANEEARAALEAAAEDEARPGRRQRVSLEETSDVRRAGAALRARARLAIGAARALGATDEALEEATDAVTASEEAEEPLAALRAADRAHRAALAALGDVRRTFDGPGRDGPGVLAEAAQSEGFDVEALPEGVAVEASRLFGGRSTRLARSARTRIERLARLIAAHPHGPVQVQVQVTQAGSGGERLAQRRAEAVRRALIAQGADESRLSAEGLPSSLRPDTPVARVRLLFVAYAVRP